MFYRFNRITQNLNKTTQDVAMGRPITPQAFTTVLAESPKIYYDGKPAEAPRQQSSYAAAAKPGERTFQVPNSNKYKSLMRLQALMTANDGKLVWQKLPRDKTLYFTTIALAVAGVGLSVFSLVRLATPPQNQ